MPYINQPSNALKAGSVPIADIANPGTGKVVGSAAGAAAAVFPPGYEIGYTQITTTANVTDTAENTATALISPGALTFDGGPVIVEFFCPNLSAPQATSVTNFVRITLFEGVTQIGRLGQLVLTDLTSAQGCNVGVTFRFRFTPTAGAHTYTVCGFVNSVTGTPAINCGAGGTGAFMPAYVRFTKV